MTQAPSPPPTYMHSPSKPRLKLPPGACDAHVHVMGPGSRFPFADVKLTKSDAPKEKLFALHAFLGIEHCLIVHTTSHGYDNSATADALAAKGGAYRGVALVPTDVSDAELKRLTAAGFCGARFHYMPHIDKGGSIDEVVAFGKRLAAIGWHLQIHMDASLIEQLAPTIYRSAVPVVIDHMGRLDASRGLDHPEFRALLALMQDKNVWMKVSGVDRITRQGPPYADAVPFARKLVAEFGDRCVWGTDWPHPNHAPPIPDDGMLVELLAEIAPNDAALKALLVDNPQRLYRFAPAKNN